MSGRAFSAAGSVRVSRSCWVISITSMKKMVSWNTTSIIGVMFTPGSFLLMRAMGNLADAAYSSMISTLRRTLIKSMVRLSMWRMMFVARFRKK